MNFWGFVIYRCVRYSVWKYSVNSIDKPSFPLFSYALVRFKFGKKVASALVGP